MFKKIFGFFHGLRVPVGRIQELEAQVERARHLEAMLGLAYKLDADVIITVEVGNQKQGLVVDGKSKATEWLYNFTCGERMRMGARIEDIRNKAENSEMGG